MSGRRRKKDDDDDGLLDDDDDDEDEDEAPAAKKRKKSSSGGMFDDAAEESGDEDDDEDEEEDDENANEYVKDGFLVDEDDDDDDDDVRKRRKKKKQASGDLEDSDDDDEEDDDDDDDDDDSPKKRRSEKKKRLKKLRGTEQLADDDLDLIREAQGLGPMEREEEDERQVEHIRARDAAELGRGLFHEGDDDDDDDDAAAKKKKKKQAAAQKRAAQAGGGGQSEFDDDYMGDFIEDDLHDQDAMGAGEGGRRGMMMLDDEGGAMADVSQEALNNASEIFGTDYLDFLQQDDDAAGPRDEDGERRGEDDEDNDDDDSDGSLFDADDDDEDDAAALDGLSAQQKAEALKLKRDKLQLKKQERRKLQAQKKAAARKAQLRRVFEPVQLIENFCTDRDDAIRQTDAPERLFDWLKNAKFYGKSEAVSSDSPLSEMERQQAEWIVTRIPEIAQEYTAAVLLGGTATAAAEQESILSSIAFALRYMHRDKLEPAFLQRYRKDYVRSPAVRQHLHTVVEQEAEWDRLVQARNKVQQLLDKLAAEAAQHDKGSSAGANGDDDDDGDAQETKRAALQEQLEQAQQELDDTQARASTLQAELDALGKKDEEDDNLFENDDDDDDEKEAERQKERARVASSLKDVQDLVTLRLDRVNQCQAAVQLAAAQAEALKDRGPMERVLKKQCRAQLWNATDYATFLQTLSDAIEVVDVNNYLHLIQEGNEAIQTKELPILSGGGGSGSGKDKKSRRSRRFDRDYYRTCVAEGLRSVAYQFLLAPHRVGIQLEHYATLPNQGFDYTRQLPGADTDKTADPLQWVPPQVPQSPTDFAQELIGSGELVLLAEDKTKSGNSTSNSANAEDPLRGCRYVAALELASEPRVRKYVRKLYRQYALLSTKPTKRGLEEIDAFHDYYGLHLVKNKPVVTEHFGASAAETAARRAGLSAAERHELDTKLAQRRQDSCLQYLHMVQAAQAGFLTIHLHLPLTEQREDLDWYRPDNTTLTLRSNQKLDLLSSELERAYLPPDGDVEAWNAQRQQVVQLALTHFLLPTLEAELRRELRHVCNQVGAQAAAGNLRKLCLQGPYRPDRQQPPGLYYNESRFIVPTGDLPVVGYCCSLEGKEASYLAYCNKQGKAEDYLAIPSGTRVDAGKMREKVILFLIRARPAAVVVGTSGGFESRIVYRKLTDLVTEAKNRWSSRFLQGDDEDDEAFKQRQDDLEALSGKNDFEDDEVEWKCDVELLDDKVAQLFGRSVRGTKEFDQFAAAHKCAIALARYAKNPLAELTYTWSVASDAGVFGTEFMYLNIHPLQRLLPRTLLLREYERVLCDVTAAVGADINATCSADHLRGLLMFIPGLGPRKAAHLKQLVNDGAGVVSKRRDLLDDRLLGPIVYNNAVAFLRISQIDALYDQQLHPLDNTRLHPAIYIQHDWAIKIAFDALERENVKAKAHKALTDAMSNSQQEVARLLEATQAEWERSYQSPFNFKEWDPRVNVPAEHWGDEVGGLDLDAFANAIELKGHGRWHSHFEMLLWEYRLPFLDPRKPLEPLDGDTLFTLITGESDQSLRPGKEVTGKVVTNGEFGSRVKLEGDIPAFIPLRNLSDDHVEAAEDVVSPGQVVTAIITEVKKDHMTVDMSLKLEDFRKLPSSWERPASLTALDVPYFDTAAATRVEEDSAKRREAHLEALQVALNKDGTAATKRKKRVVRRACTHPAFRNAKHDEVDRELRQAGASMVGQALIRPSNKQSDSLAVHWVVKEGSIKVIEVLEEDKETDAAIGNVLKIKDETYGSLDELLGRYVEPLNDFVEELRAHRKFVDLPEDDVDEKLKAEKKQNPKGIPYALCWMDVHPGYASLRFIITATPRHHSIGLTPRGLVWSGRHFLTVDQLLNEFKKNPRGHTVKKPTTAAVEPPKSVTTTNAAAALPPKPPVVPPPPSRWGAPKPPAAPAAAVGASWQQQSQPPPPRPPPPRPAAPPTAAWGAGGGGWGDASSVAGSSVSESPAPPRPPPPRPPAPPAYTNAAAPPPPRPPPPPPAANNNNNFAAPPPQRPPGPPPAFPAAPPAGAAPIGRGRGRTLPAWMAKQQQQQQNS